MLLADKRVELEPRPAARRQAPVEVVMIGHCPAPGGPTACPSDGPAAWQRLARDSEVREQIAALGFIQEAERLRRLDAGETDVREGDDDLRALFLLPVPVRSLGHFQALFPLAFETDSAYGSTLAGRRAWLPAAVQDFFAGAETGRRDTRTLWVIRVPQAEAVGAFLPRARTDLTAPSRLAAFERALLIARAGILALPDLERLLVPAALPDVPRVRLANPEPVFLPCGTEIDDGHRERRYGNEMPPASQSPAAKDAVSSMVRTLARLRPDMQCLLTLPLDMRPRDELPAPSGAFLRYIAETAADVEGSKLRHLQLLWPYLRGAGRPLGSACGLVAGAQARVAERHGAWRSIAGRPLPDHLLPWPPVTQQQATAWREAPGVTVLLQRGGRLQVDDEALCAPCLPAADLRAMNDTARTLGHWRSAETMRFMGWLRRELQALGERLVFDLDPRDPRPEIALHAFFGRLHGAGALRGARAEDAFRIRALPGSETMLAFDIEVAPAYPIDRLRITFLQDRHAATQDTRIEAADA